MLGRALGEGRKGWRLHKGAVWGEGGVGRLPRAPGPTGSERGNQDLPTVETQVGRDGPEKGGFAPS